jgi:hypothetical protein
VHPAGVVRLLVVDEVVQVQREPVHERSAAPHRRPDLRSWTRPNRARWACLGVGVVSLAVLCCHVAGAHRFTRLFACLLPCWFVGSFCLFVFARLHACLFVPGCFLVRSLGLSAVGLLARLLAGCVSRASVARKLGSFVGSIARMVWSLCAWTTVASAPGRDDIRVERPRLLLRRELPALRGAERFATQRCDPTMKRAPYNHGTAHDCTAATAPSSAPT